MKDLEKIKKIIRLWELAPDDDTRLELLKLLFTAAERQQLSARYDIVEGLIKGQKTQRELSTLLKLSIAKITRGSNALKLVSPRLKAYLTLFFARE